MARELHRKSGSSRAHTSTHGPTWLARAMFDHRRSLSVQDGRRLCDLPLFLPPRCARVRPRVFAAARAARCRSADPRRRAALLAKRDSAECDAAEDPRLFSAFIEPRALPREVLVLPLLPLAVSRAACARTFFDEPRFGGGSFTPARLAFDNPIAIACCGEAAPCFPSRM
jgi:hypothetical protein